MGYSLSAGAIILLIASVIAATSFIPAVDEGITQITEGYNEQQDIGVTRHNTDFSIIEAEYDQDADTLTVRANNTGTETLELEHVDLLMDGEYVFPNTSVNGDTSRDYWTPGTVATFTVDTGQFPIRVTLTTKYGLSRAANVTVV